MATHLPTGPLKTRSGLEPVPTCEPITYQPISADDITTAPSGPVCFLFFRVRSVFNVHIQIKLL